MPRTTPSKLATPRPGGKTNVAARRGDSNAVAPAAESKIQNGPDQTPWLFIRGARQNNLKNLDVGFPLGRFVCVTGVSGSGKSSLVNEILHNALAIKLNKAESLIAGEHDAIDGLEHLDKIIAIDQTPIGRTPRSNPVTYIKVFDEIRDLFTRMPDAKLRGYKPGRFSFNVSGGPKGGGRCEACEGNGSNRIEMDFLADVWVTCPVCEGKRFTRETLQIQFKGKSISDVLEMDIQQALELFDNQPRIRAMLQTLHDVGLDYIKLGQPSTTLSGGEAQRIKLARELVKKPTGRTMYVLDEPTTGLHFDDIRRLLSVLHGFVDAGNSVVVIEHNLDVIKTADWLIDLGPEGGEAGGYIVTEGTPEEVAAVAASHTGESLRKILGVKVEGRRMKAERKSAVGRSISAFDLRPSTFDMVRVRGAREHNLKDVSVEFPRDRMTVCTGVSGSGKTSFAIDTVFTEGYRRYVESLSAYARQFLGQLTKPRVEHIEGLSPAICIEQKAASKSPRSTVGTVTEIYDYMRVLWARVGMPYCPRCQAPVGSQTIDEIVARVMGSGDGTPIILLAPIGLGDGENYSKLFQRLKNSGYVRVRVDGEILPVAQATTLDARRKHTVEVVIDRTVVRAKSRGRINESIEHALMLGDGRMILVIEPVEQHEEIADFGLRNADSAGTDGAASNSDGSETDQEFSAQQAGLEEDFSTHPAETESAIRSPKSEITKPGAKPKPAHEILFSQRRACTKCGTSYEDLSPQSFSFNSQFGWCETCEGLGVQRGAPAAAIVRDPDKTLFNGAIAGWNRIEPRSPFGRILTELCEHLGVAPNAPLKDWTHAQSQTLLYGTTGDWIDAEPVEASKSKTETRKAKAPTFRFHWRGFFPTIDAATRNSWALRHQLANVVTDIPCVACRGGRLRADPAAVRLGNGEVGAKIAESGIHGATIVDICNRPLAEVASYFEKLKLDARQKKIAGEVLHEIRNRLQFLLDVGLEYLTLHRSAPTLSGGEAQRIRLASQIGSGLTGVLYVLDEPTIGLHPRDTRRLVDALTKLRDLGNTLLLVEHDRDVIASADRLLDFGPRAGKHGGRIVADGTPEELRVASDEERVGGKIRKKTDDRNERASLTRGYLSGALAIPIPTNRRPIPAPPENLSEMAAPATKPRRRSMVGIGPQFATAAAMVAAPEWLCIRGARQHNLKNIDLPIPLGRLVCVTGVSGSGKSSLINDILWPELANRLQMANQTVGAHRDILGIEHVDKIVNVDQSPIGATPVSNPATYTGVFDDIRELYARLPEAKVRGYQPGRFSFNRPGGRCEACVGYGQRCIEMHFMPDVWVECEVCRGKRYNPETLEVKFRGKSIAEVLDMPVAEALELFTNVPRIRRMLQTLSDVGLGYVQLGQPAHTLSGGEAQRVKLATELGKPDTGRTIYLLDEPTTGLHFDDVRKLLDVLQRLVDLGNSVLVVEHNLDVLKSADWIIDLGPEAGDAGGQIVVMGTPEDIVANAREKRSTARPQLVTHRSPLAARSHTAAALAPILDAGPFAERTPFDREKYLAELVEAEKRGFGDIGKEVKQPWQVDGRRWHLEQRLSRDGKPSRWDGKVLEFIEKLVQDCGGFEPTNWNERASVEITAPGADVWFAHFLTGGEWLLECYFMVPQGSVDGAEWNRKLGLKTLDEREDLQTYGNWPRVETRTRQGGHDAVVVYVHDLQEIDTPAFRKFIKAVATAYFKGVE